MTGKIGYTDGYKYQLALDYEIRLDFAPTIDINEEYFKFSTEGLLCIKEGYAWDGASGPTYDSKDSMRGSLVHDALYQMMREKLLDEAKYRKLVDLTFYHLCLEDGMWKPRAWIWYRSVRAFAESAADPKNDKKIIYAP